MNNEKPEYLSEYEDFQKAFKLGETSPDQVGELILKMAGHFARYNLQYANKIRNISAVKANLINSNDENGKPMSASKAEILADATEEGAGYKLAQIHINNIQELINSLKSVQKSLMIEFGNVQ